MALQISLSKYWPGQTYHPTKWCKYDRNDKFTFVLYINGKHHKVIYRLEQEPNGDSSLVGAKYFHFIEEDYSRLENKNKNETASKIHKFIRLEYLPQDL